ncbi:MAG: signal peptidase II [Bacteriovoracaceae bacterium]|jgi:signal peptidase II|nr:signal peptidase II [Bacteriovoracaceae bacterium]
MKKAFLFFLLALFIIVLDQWSKWYIDTHFYLGESYKVIDGLFNLTYVRNSGAAFGMFGYTHEWLRVLVLRIIPVIACIWLIWGIINHKKNTSIINIGYTLIFGGAVGNLIDRFRLDYVVDMLDFYQGSAHFATFNVADSSISVAAGLLILDHLYQSIKLKK